MPTILITGANKGLGFGFAKRYAEDGWRVLASCRDINSAEELQELSKKYSKERIIINSLYPGCVADTKLFRDTPWLFRFLFPIFQKFITKGYVSQRLAGERVAQVATLKEYAKPAVHWSWGNRQKLGRKAFSQKLSKRIIDSDISRQTYELTRKLVGLA